MIEASEFSEEKPQVKFANLGRLFKKNSQGGLKFDFLLEQFEALEKEIGELPTISIIENLTEEMKDKYYDYLISEYLQMSLSTFSQMSLFSDIKNEKKKERLPLLSLIQDDLDFFNKCENIIGSYIKEWEINYNIFVKPIIDRLKKLKIVPEKIDKGRYGEINTLNDYFKTKESFSKLPFFFEPMDTNMRNAFVHLDYFIDQNENQVGIIDRYKKTNNLLMIPLDEIIQKTMRLKVNRFFLLVLITKKLSIKLGIKWE